MKVFKILFLLLITVLVPLNAQVTYFTNVSDKQIKTLQVKVAGEMFSDPFIELGGENRIEVNFDAFNPGFGRYAYNLVHCNADWTQSNLSPIEYMNGFQGSTIEDFANAMGTTVQYTNYRLLVPNDDVQPKVSGNYALQVYNEDDPSQIVFTACFSIFEPMVSVAATVSGTTDIDTNQSHQQVSFAINNKNFPITYPQTDLKIWVYQNNRRDNAVTGLQPMTILENQISYTNNQNLIFPAGNEYRRFEMVSTRYASQGVESIRYHAPYYHVTLQPDLPRLLNYSYDQDQNGRFVIRYDEAVDNNTEADYFFVHFSLLWENPLTEGKFYLQGAFTYDDFNEENLLKYNPETHAYECARLLKQGAYNYQYLYVAPGSTVGSTAQAEGNFYETENEYLILVYHRPFGERYDRLIGMQQVSYK